MVIDINKLRGDKAKGLDVSIGLRLPRHIREQARKLAAENSDEFYTVTESSIYRRVIIDALEKNKS